MMHSSSRDILLPDDVWLSLPTLGISPDGPCQLGTIIVLDSRRKLPLGLDVASGPEDTSLSTAEGVLVRTTYSSADNPRPWEIELSHAFDRDTQSMNMGTIMGTHVLHIPEIVTRYISPTADKTQWKNRS